MIRDPLVLFDRVVAALSTGAWETVAALSDPASIRLWQAELLDEFAPYEFQDQPWPDELTTAFSHLPGEVAEQLAARARAQHEPEQRLAHRLPWAPSVSALRATSAPELLAQWLAGTVAERHRLAQQYSREPAAGGSGEFRYVMAPLELVGVVADGEEFAHVLYRYRMSPSDAEAPETTVALSAEDRALSDRWALRRNLLRLSCRRQPDGGWLLLAGPTLEYLPLPMRCPA